MIIKEVVKFEIDGRLYDTREEAETVARLSLLAGILYTNIAGSKYDIEDCYHILEVLDKDYLLVPRNPKKPTKG